MSVEGLRVVDGFNLPEEYQALLRPGEAETDFHGNVHHLPRFFLRNHQLAGSARSSAGTALQALGIDVGGLP